MKRRGVRRWLKLPNREVRDTEAEVDAELAAHVDARIEQLVADGMSREAALAEAERRLGGLAGARYRLVREAWERDRRLTLVDRMREWRDDARHAARSVLRERGFAAVVILTLALGIGANAVMFGIVDRLLLSGPAHVQQPGELYRFHANVQYAEDRPLSTWSALNNPTLEALRGGVPSMRHVSGYFNHRRVLGVGVESREVDLVGVSASFFELLGVRPVLGRFLDDSEDNRAGGEHVIVLSHELWQAQFGGRDDVLGESVELSGRAYSVVGVAPPGFTGVELAGVDGWVPLSVVLARSMPTDWADNWMSFMVPIVGRLAPGVTAERAAAEATAAWRALHAGVDAPEALRSGHMTVAGIRAGPSGEEPLEARVSLWLVGVSLIVLLVACANVANLHFARGLRRRREVAVRLSLGITRSRLLRLLLLESLVLAVLGGIAALAVAYWGAQVVRTVLLPQVDWSTSPLNARVLLVSGALTLLVAVITGLAPALQSLSTRLAPALAGSVHAPPAPGRVRSVLAVLQAAFCVVLLVGAGLFVRSLQSVRGIDIGMEPDRVLQLQLSWQPQPQLSDEEVRARRNVFIADAMERMRGVPGVESVSAAIGSPFHGAFGGGFLRAPGDSVPRLPGGSYLSAVTSEYFGTLGTHVVRGRVFRPDEGAGTEPVVIVSRSTADAFWPGEDPVGRCMYPESGAPECVRVVGVVADVRRFQFQEDAGAQFYVPLGQQSAWLQNPALLVRTRDPHALGGPVRRALHELEPTLGHVRTASYRERLDPQWRPWQLGATLFMACGALALAIAVIGLYSVIAYMVLHRTHEIGVRMALGAERRDIVGMVTRQALQLAGAGVLIGLAVALLAGRFLEPLLFDTEAYNPAVLAAAAAVLAHAGLAAGIVPALRASRVPPTEALRS